MPAAISMALLASVALRDWALFLSSHQATDTGRKPFFTASRAEATEAIHFPVWFSTPPAISTARRLRAEPVIAARFSSLRKLPLRLEGERDLQLSRGRR